MQNKMIKYFLLVLAILIVAIIATNYIGNKPKNAKQNPYEYNVEEFKTVPDSLISHTEVRQVKITVKQHGSLTSYENTIWFSADNSVKNLSLEGKILADFTVSEPVRAIAVTSDLVVVAYEKKFAAYSHDGEKAFESDVITDSTYITSVAFLNGKIVIADAGKRKIYIYDKNLKGREIEGISGAKNLHGFVIPSPYFDVAVSASNELWAANTGMHSLQHYDENGNLLDSWEKISNNIDGFCGCCNPAHFALMTDGRFVTSEKGLTRIKIYSRTGELESVVAGPDVFVEDGHAPEVAVIGDTVIALDFDRKMIRIFGKRESK